MHGLRPAEHLGEDVHRPRPVRRRGGGPEYHTVESNRQHTPKLGQGFIFQFH